jgi:1-deoxy-D-xylulose-5-phosphate reductoisomerase
VSPRRVTVLGSTGSVGVSTLSLLEETQSAGDVSVEIEALVGGRNVALLAEQALRWRPKITVIADPAGYAELTDRLRPAGLEAACGDSAVIEAASRSVDWVMAAIVGFAGLAPTLAAARTGAVIGLANKESIVCAGPALLALSRSCGGKVIPVDSEHSAIFQALNGGGVGRVSRLILTASGGPFRTWSREAMANVTLEQALAHPVWRMGPKISLDSATLANKGLELIEASFLFGTHQSQIDVLVHPQSIVHSLVEYQDGSTMAQLGPPDMRTPIACAYAWPDRLPWRAPRLDLAQIGQLTFEPPDLDRFPMLKHARESLNIGEFGPCAFNAANEVAVDAFVKGQIRFLDISSLVEASLNAVSSGSLLAKASPGDVLDAAKQVDFETRRIAQAKLSLIDALI